jgi:hypothetical protein
VARSGPAVPTGTAEGRLRIVLVPILVGGSPESIRSTKPKPYPRQDLWPVIGFNRIFREPSFVEKRQCSAAATLHNGPCLSPPVGFSSSNHASTFSATVEW